MGLSFKVQEKSITVVKFDSAFIALFTGLRDRPATTSQVHISAWTSISRNCEYSLYIIIIIIILLLLLFIIWVIIIIDIYSTLYSIMGYERKKKSTCSTVTFVYSLYLKKMKKEIKLQLQKTSTWEKLFFMEYVAQMEEV